MSKKTNNLDDLQSTLGLGKKITGFADNIDRIGYPICLKDFKEFWENIQMITSDTMWLSYMSDDGNALRTVLSLTFKSEDIDDILENIYAQNYETIIKQIFDLNGINFNKDDNDGASSKNK